MKQLFLFTVVALFWAACSSPKLPQDVAEAYKSLPDKIDYNQHVKPILSDRCFSCHGPDKGKLEAGLRLDIKDAAYAELSENKGKKAIVPGNLTKSEVFHRIISEDPEYVMPSPKSHLTLTAKEKATLIKWIEDGAEYKPHWAFIKPEKETPPSVKSKNLVKNPIDNFIINRLEKENISLLPEAEKSLLLRRLSLDLTGLPPNLAEINTFLADNSPNAYEKQVDRLLASPHYGEKMAVDWLDVARYADSHGYTVDRLRDMSPWRDWVIRAFNQNLHYDDFIKWQLAGDLLPNPTQDQLIATAFNRNHQQNMEGGIVEEEFRVEYVADRANTTGQAFMALTVGCAKCHDHKFDPISQKEYYSLFSYFNNVKEAGQISWDNAMPAPTMLLPDAEKQKVIDYLQSVSQQKQAEWTAVQGDETTKFEQWLNNQTYKSFAKTPNPQGLVAYYPLSKNLKNAVGDSIGEMMREGGVKENPVFVADGKTAALQFEGDIWLNTKMAQKFGRYDPFSIGLWVNVPKELKEGVVFHQGISGLLYNFRGFHLLVKNQKLELEMAHTAPYNAIIKYTTQDIPRDEWVQLTVTYDGSSQAAGYKIYLNGVEMPTTIDQDKLYKDILFTKYDKSIEIGKNFKQPVLQFGAWERGKGLAKGKMKEIKVFDRALTHLEVIQIQNPWFYQDIVSKAPPQLNAYEKHCLQDFYNANVSTAYSTIFNEKRRIFKENSPRLDSIPELMIMQEMPERRKSYILDRGQYDVYKDEVTPDIPIALLPMPADYPKNRLGLAMWLVHRDHPLTARVAVNRYWQMFFGRGLVKTSEDFGNQGEMPSHPELLDWLSVTFMESGWDVKALVKTIVMSGTYRQDSKADEARRNIDPENVLLSRGPSDRLTGEMLRDQVLAASGLLNDTIGGASVFPYQTDGLWRINGAEYKQDSGTNLYRRSLYTIWKRSVPNPTLATFDIDIRTSCISRRQRTNTPLQALVTLNDPTFVEAAKVIGMQMTKETDRNKAISDAFIQLSGRKPTENELALLAELAEKSVKKFTENPQKAKGWLGMGATVIDKNLPVPLLAANTVVASTIINSDAAITKR